MMECDVTLEYDEKQDPLCSLENCNNLSDDNIFLIHDDDEDDIISKHESSFEGEPPHVEEIQSKFCFVFSCAFRPFKKIIFCL
jgi:hypothetical protein